MDERRKGVRSKSLLGARIVYNNRASTIDCTVRNISPTGARLVFGGPVAAPDEFDLVISQKERTHRCRIAWRKANEIGVAFVDAQESASPIDAARRIKALEDEKAALKRRLMQLTGES
jgi:hypothetical protein